MQAVGPGHHSGNRKDSQVEAERTDVDQMASSTIVVDKSSVGALVAQPKLVRERSQQTCVVDARQHTIASGSCCPVGDSRSCLGCCTESSDANAHAKTDRRGSKMVHSAPGRVS
jgi:hypothetical protein